MQTSLNAAIASPGFRDRLVDIRTVCREINRCRSGVYALMKAGDFPRPRKTGTRRRAWLQSEVEAWIKSREAA